MSAPSAKVLQQYLHRLCEQAAAPADAVLLERFVQAKDRAAFEMLIARHGPMVLGAARRLVEKSHDTEDVFQAVFLSLARLAKTIRQGQTLPAWLHKATCRIAAKVRAKDRQRRGQETCAKRARRVENDPAAGLVWHEVRQALDEELQRLPDRLRSPLVLCYLCGLTRDEAAKQLGWSLGTLKRRLEEGRKTLRLRLEWRGIAAVGLALTVLHPEALQAAVSKSLLDSALSLVFSTRGAVPSTISALVLSSAGGTKGVAMKSIFVLVVGIAVGVGIYAAKGQADQEVGQEAAGAGVGKEPNPVHIGQVKDRSPVPQGDDPLPAGATLRFGTSRFRHGFGVETMAVSPDGKMAFVTNDSTSSPPRAFDLATGRVVFTLNWGSVEAAKYSPIGLTLVFRQGHALYVRDAVTGDEIRTIEGPRDHPWRGDVLEFTPDGKAIALVSQGKVVHLIDYENGRTIRAFAHENPESGLKNDFTQVLAVAFSPNGNLMATGGYANDKENYFARLWDVETGRELRRFLHGKQGSGISSLSFSPDGKTLATLGTQAGVLLRLFDVNTGELRKAFPRDDGVRPGRGSVAFTPDGKTVAAAGTAIRLYDTTTGEERLRIDRRASDLQFTEGGKTLTGAVGGTIYRWDTATGKSLIPEAADSVVDQILVTADGKRVITRGQDGYAHVWDGASAKHLHRFAAGRMAISPDGRFLAWAVDDYSVRFEDPATPNTTYYGTRIRLYDVAADQFVDRFPAFTGSAQDVAFAGNGKKLVLVDGHPGLVRVWDFEAAKEERSFSIVLKALKEKEHFVVRTLLSPDGKTAVVTYQEDLGGALGGALGPPQHVRFWDVGTGTELPGINGGHRGRPVDKAFSHDGRLVVTSTGMVIETATGKQVTAFHDLYPRAAAFSRDGRLLATTGAGNAIQLWDTATWTKRTEYEGHRDQTTALAFTPGGQLLSGSIDTTVLAWDVAVGKK